MSQKQVNVLTFTTLYPNSEQPTKGIFVENRLRQLVKRHPQVQITVVAPVPWFPLKSRRFGRYAAHARVPREEQRHGIRVLHPRYLLIPKAGMSIAPLLMFLSLLLYLRHLVRSARERYDLLDAHYFYPDGVAAVMLGSLLRLPVVVTARGTDINLFPQWWLPRLQLRWAIRHANAVVTVCQALKDQILTLATGSTEVSVLRNGVDLEEFAPPADREELRRQLGFSKFTLLCVGNLVENKGPHLVLEAVREHDDVHLVFAGGGELADSLKTNARTFGVSDRVVFSGVLERTKLRRLYQAADWLILASSREGWPNVLLESMACGTPVIVTRVGGTPEIVGESECGVLLNSRTSTVLAEAIRYAQQVDVDRVAVRRWAEQFSWDATSDGLWVLFARVVAKDSRGSRM